MLITTDANSVELEPTTNRRAMLLDNNQLSEYPIARVAHTARAKFLLPAIGRHRIDPW